MTTVTTPTSELEAINTMLACIGELPVDQVDSPVAAAVAARLVLNETCRAVLSTGWRFNVEKNYPLVADAFSGEVSVPASCLWVDTVGNSADMQVSQRGTRLYDMTNHTFNIGKTVNVDMAIMLEFQDMPETGRHYIMVRAARVFQGRNVGAEALFRFEEEDEISSLRALKRAEGITGKHNIFDNASAQETLRRI